MFGRPGVEAAAVAAATDAERRLKRGTLRWPGRRKGGSSASGRAVAGAAAAAAVADGF